MHHPTTSPTQINRPLSRRLAALLASLPLTLAIAHAQTSLDWSAAGNSTLGGTGDWNSVASTWWNGASAQSWPAAGTRYAVFNGTAGTVSLTEPLSTSALRFLSTGYILAGAQNLTLDGTPFIEVAGASTTATLGNNTALVLTGTNGFTKLGTGTLVLNSSAPQTLGGPITLAAGTLALQLTNLSTPTNLLPSTVALIGQGGTMTLTGKSGSSGSQTVGSLQLLVGNTQLRAGNPTGAPTATTNTTLNLPAVSRPVPGSVLRLNLLGGGFGTANSATDRIFLAGTTPGTWVAPWLFTGDQTTNTLRWVYADAGNNQLRQQSGLAAGASMDSVTSATSVYSYTTNNGNFTLAGPRAAMGLQNTSNFTANLGAHSLTLSGYIAVNTNTNAVFNSGGGSIQIGDLGELITAGIGTITFNAGIVDKAGTPSHLTHIGAGALILGGTSSYTGATTVIGGRLEVSSVGTDSGGVINSSSGVFVYPGATFRQDNFLNPLTAPVSLLGGRMEGFGIANIVTVSNSTGNVLANRTTTIAPLQINNLVFQGAATLSPTVGSGVLPFYAVSLTTTPANGKVVINPIAPVGGWVDGTTTYDIMAFESFSGSVSDFVVGTGTPAFAARQSAVLFIENNILKMTVSGDKALWTGAANSNWTTATIPTPFNWKTQATGATAQFVNNDEVVFDDTALNTNVVISDANVSVANMFVNTITTNYTISSPSFGIIGSGNVIKTGAGTLTLGGTNSYTGLTTVTEGRLALGSSTAFQGTGAVLLGSSAATTSNTAILDLNGNSARVTALTVGSATTNSITNAGTGTGTDTLTLVASTGNLPALITDGPTRKVALAVGTDGGQPINVNNTYSGGLTMFGTVGGGTSARFSPAVARNPIYSGETLVSSPYGIGPITMGLSASDRAQFYFNADNTTIGNDLIINSMLGTDTPGALRVEGLNTLIAGKVLLNQSSLLIHNHGQFTGGTGGTVTFTKAITSSGLTPNVGFRAQQLNPATTKQLIITLANQTATANDWPGETNLNGLNVYLKLGAANQIPDGTGKGNLVMTSSTFDLNDFSETINGLSGSGFVENIAGTNPVTLTVGAGDATGTTFSGVIFDARGGAPLSLTKVGTGTQVLSGENQYTGATTISGGTLQIGAGGTVGSILPASTITNNGVLAFNRSNAVSQGTHFGSPINGSGGLTKLGAGSLTLTEVNGYAGATTLTAGSILLTGSGTLGTGKVTLAATTTLDVAGSSASSIALAGGLGGTGTVTATGKDLIIGGSFTPVSLAITGNVSLSSGAATALVAGPAPTSTSNATVTGLMINGGSLSIAADPSLTFAEGQSFTFFSVSGGISSGFSDVSVGALALAPQAAGVWTATADNLAYTYTESSGTLTVATGGPVLSPIESWRLLKFGSAANSGTGADGEDPDFDGFNNLMEYALGGEPLVNDRSINPTVSGTNPLSITFNRIADPSITYIVEVTSNLLGTWTTVSSTSGTAGSTTVLDPGPVVGTTRFIRLRVVQN